MTLMEWSVSVVRSESEFSSEIRLSRFISLEQWEFNPQRMRKGLQ